ncbi:MAG TPA: sigma-70 family RNA polymerase sigma factor, partial [Acidimicrobiales bacterium]
TQDAMVRVLRKWRTIDHPDHYARRAVVNACNSHHRRRALARRHPQPGPESYELEAQELSDALAQLPPRQRAALVLRYWGDLPEADIADAIGVKRSTVASLLRRAHAQLKETIDHD